MKILVTGGAGFIGSHVTDQYVAAGHEVVVVDNLTSGFCENVNPRAMVYQADVRDTAAIAEIFARERPEVVNHHAAQMDVRRSAGDPIYDAECNIIGSLNILQAARRVGTRKVVYISSGGAVYGEPLSLPVSEDHAIAPLSEYGISKHTVEHYLRLYSVREGLRYTVLRYGNVYGPRQNPYGEAGVVSIFALALLKGERPTLYGDGRPTRDYVYVEDIARINETVLTRGDNEIYNVGTGVSTSVQRIFELLQNAVGSCVKPRYAVLRPGEIWHIATDSRKAQRELGWEPIWSLPSGIAETARWCRARIQI